MGKKFPSLTNFPSLPPSSPTRSHDLLPLMVHSSCCRYPCTVFFLAILPLPVLHSWYSEPSQLFLPSPSLGDLVLPSVISSRCHCPRAMLPPALLHPLDSPLSCLELPQLDLTSPWWVCPPRFAVSLFLPHWLPEPHPCAPKPLTRATSPVPPSSRPHRLAPIPTIMSPCYRPLASVPSPCCHPCTIIIVHVLLPPSMHHYHHSCDTTAIHAALTTLASQSMYVGYAIHATLTTSASQSCMLDLPSMGSPIVAAVSISDDDGDSNRAIAKSHFLYEIC